MNSALANEDVINVIIDQLPAEDRQITLANLAQLRKGASSEVALNLLWCRLNDIEPLIDILRRQVPGLCVITRPSYRKTLQRPIRVGELDRFLIYSRRVKVLTVKDDFVQAEVFPAIHSLMPFTKIFPSLHTLHWKSEFYSELAGVELLALPTLRTFSITLAPCRRMPHNEFSPFFSLFAQNSPYLDNWDLDFPTGIPEALLAPFIDQLPYSRTIRMILGGPITHRTLTHFGLLPVLETLEVGLPWLDISPENFSFSKPLQFQSLTHLNLRVKTMHECLCCLSGAPMLRKLVLTCNATHFYHSSDLHSLFDTITRLYLHLQTLQILLPGVWRGANDPQLSPEHYRVTINTLRPLLNLGGLTELVLKLGYAFDVTDSDMIAIIVALPHLEHLVITTCPVHPDDFPHVSPRVSFDGLWKMLIACPKLRVLGMPIDARTIRWWSSTDRYTRRPLFHGLERFDVGASQLAAEDWRAVSAFFKWATPKVTLSALQDRWKSVERDLRGAFTTS